MEFLNLRTRARLVEKKTDIKDMKPTRLGQPVKRRLCNVQEVSEYTGLSVSTLYCMVSQRRIPFVKVGRLTKFDLRLLDEWLAKHTVMPLPLKNAEGGTASKN